MPIRTTVEIAKHLARSKALITIYGTEGGYDPNAGTPTISGSNGLKLLGGVTSLTLPVNRGSSERRELNAANFARIEEIIPGLVDFEGAKLNHIVTYKETFLQRCGFDDLALDIQAYPMLFLLTLPTPNPSQFPALAVILEGVTIKTNPLEFSVEEKEDLRITQAVDLHIAKVRLLKI